MNRISQYPANLRPCRQPSAIQRWGWPVALAVLSIVGLLSALLGQGGVWWFLSWVALSTPLVVILVLLWRGPRRGTKP